MIDSDAWEKQNTEYIDAGLAWLRLLLRRAAERGAPPPAPHRSLFGRGGGAAAGVTDEQIAAASRAMDEAAVAADPPPALILLAHRLGLDDFERSLLLLCAAPELSPEDIPTLCGLAQGDSARRHPTFALARAVLPGASWEALAPYRPLRHWRLLEITQPAGIPLAAAALRVDERIVNFMVGIVNYLDDRLASLMTGVEPAAQELPLAASQEATVGEIARAAAALQGTAGAQVVQLVGPATAAKRLAAWQAADEMGRRLYRLGADDLPRDAASLETLAVLWVREQILWGPALYLDGRETDRNSEAGAAVNRFLARTSGLVFFEARDVWPGFGDAVALVDVTKPDADEQAAAWAAALGAAAGDLPDRLAGQFNLDLGVIHRLALAALGEGDRDTLAPRLWEEALANTRPHLETLAQRIDARANWGWIVLPKQQEEQLRQICDQVRYRRDVYDRWGFRARMNRGLGISALFAGESGTGKTMAAEVIATDLGLALYRIDLSQVVSKYIGETEKNLKNVFDAAEDGGAILFFDEADALFGKRSEVKDSHDRYANIEINYLLQRMEAYRGLAILATNMKSALDAAFLRRLRFIVNLPFPGAEQRAEIWRRAFPAAVDKEPLDYPFLARFTLTGGAIQNAALGAAFLARGRPGQDGPQVTMEHALQAIRAEYRKADRPVNETEFRWLPPKAPASLPDPRGEPVAAPD
jgi:hypothetical protein